MKYLLVLTLIIQSLAMDMSELRERLSSLEDYTDKIDLRLNSLPGKDEDVTAVYNTVRTDLSYVIHRNNPKTPYTKKQIKKVNSILATFSLPQIK